jgi:hypothetical protein
MNPTFSRIKLKAIQSEINYHVRRFRDPTYRQYHDDFDQLQDLISSPRDVKDDLDLEQLKGWIPLGLNLSSNHQSVAWLDLGEISFTHTTSNMTKCLAWQRQNKPQPLFTQLDTLLSLKEVSPGLKPKGFIFHISRCGSTLLSKMLASLPRNLVSSEDFGPYQASLAHLFMAESDRFSEFFRCELLQGTISALGQPRLGLEKNYLIRFLPDSILEIGLIKKAFPETPWILIYRDPVEVIVSNLVNPSLDTKQKKNHPYFVRKRLNLTAIDMAQLTPEYLPIIQPILDFSASDIVQMSMEEFLARAFGTFFQLVLQHQDENTLVINYNQLLSESCLRKILDFFQIPVSADELAKMTAQLKTYSKDEFKTKAYRDDRADKQRLVSKKIRELADRWAMEPYLKLEAIGDQQEQVTASREHKISQFI